MFYLCFTFITLLSVLPVLKARAMAMARSSCPCVYPRLRQMAECPRSMGSTLSPSAAMTDTVASSRSAYVRTSRSNRSAKRCSFRKRSIAGANSA